MMRSRRGPLQQLLGADSKQQANAEGLVKALQSSEKPPGAIGVVRAGKAVFLWPQNIKTSFQELKNRGTTVNWLIEGKRYFADGTLTGFPWKWYGTGPSNANWILIRGQKVESPAPPT